MKSLFSLLLSLLLVGCATSSKPPAPAPAVRAVVTGEIVSYFTIEREMSALMDASYGPQVIVMDPRYGCVSEENTRRIIAEGLSTFPVDYVENARDCEDLSIELAVVLRHIFRRDTANVPLGPPIGIIGGAMVADIPELGFVSPGYPCYHAMCAVRCLGGKWLLIEVQSKQVVELTGPIYEGVFEPFLFIL